MIYEVSNDGETFEEVSEILTQKPISKESKRNDLEYFTGNFNTVKARYLKVKARNVGKAPGWHNASGLPVWIFADEVIVN